MNPIKKEKDICKIIENYNLKYEIHGFPDILEEYKYIKGKDKCITILNENNLYIDLEDDGDIIVSYTNWHNHYFNAYEKFIEDLENILKSKKCAVIISSRKRWLASYLEEPNHNYVANIKNLPKEFISEIKIMGWIN